VTLDTVRKLLKDRRISVVAKATGIHRNTITYIRDDKRYNPNYDTYKKLADYLRANP
jgi:transcriptional regulator with XRE-family HTH domain